MASAFILADLDSRLLGKHTKQNGDCHSKVEADYLFEEVNIAFDFGNACFVVRHRAHACPRLLFARSCLDQRIIDFFDKHINLPLFE